MFGHYLETFDDVICEAKKSKHVVREEYFPIYAAVEDYVKKNNLILSNVETLIEQKKNICRTYIIYGDNIFKHANNITNTIAKITIYVLMYTNVKNEDFSITMNGSMFIQLYNIQNKMRHVISPVEIKGLLMYPPEFELIDIYHKLYSPNHADKWDQLVLFEKEVRAQMYNRKKIIGGYYNKKKHQDSQNTKGKQMDNKIILDWLKGRCDYVLVGVNAVNILNGLKMYCQKVQVITDTHIEKFVKELGNLIFQYTGYHISHKQHNANIYVEPRLQKTIVSVTIPNGKLGPKTIHILDIFNSAHYELVPYTTYDKLNIGYPNVLRMFILIDVWFIRILFALKLINQQILKQSINTVFDNLENVENVSVDKFSSETYLGKFSDLVLYKKKNSSHNVFYPYNPEQYRYQKGNYRTIS
jgi:hypothetical protein